MHVGAENKTIESLRFMYTADGKRQFSSGEFLKIENEQIETPHNNS